MRITLPRGIFAATQCSLGPLNTMCCLGYQPIYPSRGTHDSASKPTLLENTLKVYELLENA